MSSRVLVCSAGSHGHHSPPKWRGRQPPSHLLLERRGEGPLQQSSLNSGGAGREVLRGHVQRVHQSILLQAVECTVTCKSCDPWCGVRSGYMGARIVEWQMHAKIPIGYQGIWSFGSGWISQAPLISAMKVTHMPCRLAVEQPAGSPKHATIHTWMKS